MDQKYRDYWSDMRQKIIDEPNKLWVTQYAVATVDDKGRLEAECRMLKERRLYVFKEVLDLLNVCNIPYFISDGTLLGCWRKGGMIDHDIDTDLSIMEEDMHRLWKNSNLMPSDIELSCVDSSTGEPWCDKHSCRPFTGSGAKKLVAIHRNMPSPPSDHEPIAWEAATDIYTYRRVGQKYLANNYALGDVGMENKLYPVHSVFPRKRALFENIPVWTPNNPVDYLSVTYGYLGEDSYWDEKTKEYRQIPSIPTDVEK
jgi:hypothetical protein